MKQRFTQLIAQAVQARRVLISSLAVVAMLAAAVYVYAAVGVTVTGGGTFPISADLAANATLTTPDYTLVGDIQIIEGSGSTNDFASTGDIILTAPAGWRFQRSGVNAVGDLYFDNGNTNISTGTINYSDDGSTITIRLIVSNTNKRDRLTITGVAVQALNGGNIPGTGSITIGVANGAVVSGLPTTLSKTLSQRPGAARSLAFRQQPSTVNVGAAITPAPRVAVVDQFGNTVTSATGSISLALTGTPVEALIDPSSGATATITNGVATFSNIRIDEGGNFNLVASYTPTAGQTLQGTSSAFVVNNLVPTVSSALPCITVGDGQNTVNVTGTGFVRGSVVRINGVSRATTFVSSTSISATLLPEDVNTAQTLTLTVFNPTPAGGSSNAVDFVIHPVLEAGTISGNTEVCEGAQNVVYTVEDIAGATFNWQVGPGATIVEGGTSNTIEVSFVGSSNPTVNISVQALNACGIAGDPSSIDVTVTPYPTGISAGPDEGLFFCTGESTTLGSGNPAVAGYTYSWSPVEGLSDPTVPNPTLTLTNSSSEAEFYTYTLTVTNGEAACAITDQVTVTVYPALIIAADDVEPVCVGNSIELRVTGDPSYTYAWTGPEGFISSEQNPVIPNATQANAGDYTVVVTNQQGCEATAVVNVEIAPLPTANAGADQRLCTQGASTSFTVTGTLSTGAAGIWSVVEGTATIASATSLETEVSVTSASATLRFTAETPEGCQAFDDVVLTVDPLPEVTLAPISDICESDDPITLSGGLPAGGTYSGPGVANGVFDPVAAGGDGTYTITYTYTNGNGCTDAATQIITVKPQPVVSVASSTGSFEICLGESITLTASGADSYIWAPANGLSGTTGGSVTARPTVTTEYTLIGTNNGCQSEPITFTVVVNPLPDVTITPTGPTEFCDGNYVDLVTENVTGYTYQWFDANDNSSVGTASTFRAIETGRYYVTVTTDKGCTLTSEAVSIIVAKLPNEASISAGTTTFCEGGSVQISANLAPDDQEYEYVWEFSNTNDDAAFTPIPGVPVTSNTYVADATGYYRVKVSDVTEGNVSDCFKTSQPIQVTVLPQPTADITSAAETQCQVEAGRNIFTVTGTYSGGTGTAGNWSATNGFTVTGTTQSTVDGVTTTTTTITAPASFSGTATVMLTATNTAATCAPASDQVTLTVQPLIAGNTITGTSEYCQNAAATALSSGTLTGGAGGYTYQWQSGSSATGTFTNISGATSASYLPSTATGGTTYYRRVVNSGECSNTSAAFAVTVTPSITTNTIAGTQNYCEDEPATALGGAVAGGTGTYTYQWQSSSSATGTFTNITSATAATYTPPTATGGTVFYRRLVTSGECADNVSNVIGITVTPAITANDITGAATYCQGATATALGGTVTGGVAAKTYQWQQSSSENGTYTNISGATAASYTPLTTTEGTVYYRRVVTSENCSSESNAVAVTVTPTITANTISGDATYCQGATAAALGGAVTGGLPSKTYQWQSSTSASGTFANIQGATAESYTPPTTAAGTLYYQRVVTSGECSTTSNVVTVTVTPAITANTISGDAMYCQGATAAALGGTVTGGLNTKSYQWQQSPNGTDQWTAAGGTNNQISYTPSTATVGTVYYRRVVSSGECSSNSNTVAITVNSPIAGNQISGEQTVCSGSPVAALGQAAGTSLSGGSTPYTYQWQTSATLNGTYTNVTGGTGANSATYTPASRTVTTQTTAYFRRVVSGGQCASISEAVAVTFTPVISGNTINATQTSVCSGGTPTQITGSAPTGGTGTYTYLWEQRVGTNGTWVAAAGTNNGRNYQPGALTATTSYRRVVRSAPCAEHTSSIVTITVNPLPTVSFSGLNNGDIFYTGGGSVTLTGSPTGGTFSGPGMSGRTFSPCTAGPGTHTIRYTYTNGQNCTSFAEKTVTVRESQYRVVVMSTPKPFCQGDNVTHEAWVVRDAASIIYPYLTNANGDPVDASGRLIGPDELPVANLNFPFPANTPDIIKQNAYRYFNPIITLGTTGQRITTGLAYQWTKNQGPEIGNGQPTFSNAGLSSLDYYAVYVSSNTTSCGPNFNRRLSSRTYTSQLYNYDITLTASKNPICPGDAVTFTATLNSEFPFWSNINLVLEWQINGVTFNTTRYSGNADALTWTTVGPNRNFIQGDAVTILFTSDTDSQDPLGSKCAGGTSSTEVTMNVNTVPAITGTTVNAACVGSTATLSVNATGTGLTYQWYKRASDSPNSAGSPLSNGGRISGANAATLNIANATATDAGLYYVEVGGTCPPTVTSQNLQLNITPVPVAYSVTPVSGASYCTGGPGVAIGMANSQAGVTYSLYRSGTTAPVETVNRTAPGAFTFPGSFTAGTYSVTATPTGSQPAVANCPQSMLNTVTITADPLPTAITAVGGSYCEITEDFPSTGALITATSSQSGVSYQLLNSSGQPVGSPVAGGSNLEFGPVLAGAYSIRATNTTTGCTSMVSQATVTETKRVEPLGDIIVTNESGEVITEQELETGQYARFTADNTFEDDRTAENYTWYIGDGTADGWEVVTGVNGPILTIESIPGGDFAVRVVVTANQSLCYTTYIGDYTTTPVVPLPVEIIYFTAAKQGHNVLLEWATASEEHNTGFEVQVSQDGFNFRKLDFVPTKNGNTVIKQVYQYTDKENGKRGTRYYRLKQIDEDGRFEYFTTKAVTFTEVASKVKAFPNPFTTKVTLDIAAENSGQVQVTMWNAVGRQLMERTVEVEEGFNTVGFDINGDLPHGIYFIRVYLDGKMHQLKMLKE